MTSSTSLFQRASAWLRKPLIVCGLVVGMTVGGAPAASADTFSFSYGGSGISFSAIITAAFDPLSGFWIPTGVISGNRNGVSVVGISPCHACLPFGAPGYPTDQAFSQPGSGGSAWDQLEYILADASVYTYDYLGPNYAGLYSGYGGPNGSTEWAGSPQPQTNIPAGGSIGYPYTGYCAPDGQRCLQMNAPDIHRVPEINASAGLGALGVLLGFLFILREMFLRRRSRGLIA